MIPSLLLVGVGRRRRVILPLPVFLLWPLLALFALAAWILLRLAPAGTVTASAARTGLSALAVACQLSGTRIDVRDPDGPQVYLRFL
ncbi:MAG: hypothetical protein JW819_01760 [Candidatus Krumholzibacteriota bacterium]|nr:hypothetical protein [Candidatus Krumholzibacteriota bacterium]